MNEIVYVAKHLRTYNVVTHCHDNWELIYCTDGSGKFSFSDDTVLEYGKGDIVVIPPKLSHENVSKLGFTNIHLNLENATLPFKTATMISDDRDQHILNAFNDSFFYYNSQFNKRQLIISALGNLIANYIIAFQSNKPLAKMVETIKADIVNNFPDCDYKLEDYMHSLPFSYDYLRKLFKSEIGVTPHRFLMEMRMQTAEKLLCSKRESEYNISTIAQMCGFSEPLYFSRVFKKFYGCSPSDFTSEK